MNINTLCIHGSNVYHNDTGAVSVPIFQNATFAHPGVGQSTGYDYSRIQNPTREHLEETLANLERGTDALAFSSGMAAITALFELFKSGDHIIISDDLYGGSHRLFNSISSNHGLLFTPVNTSEPAAVKSAVTTSTRAVFIETPTNPMMKVTDIKAMAEIAKAHGLLLLMDNTFLTPCYLNPLVLGADVVVHSGTKYLSGHNDTLAGFLVTGNEALSQRLRFIYGTTGACLSPFDSWLVLRGIKTLAIRMDRQQQNALELSEWLSHHARIKKVFYVGLPDHPDYALSQKQARGFGAMISFKVDSPQTAVNVLERVSLILYAESLGGVESLITYPMLQTHADVPEDIRKSLGIDDCLLRLSVGLEDINDLIADLDQALK
ncbi:PLP-dependent aspartate aminotransferase family protein [Eubacterium sp. 1001713B170207_170306_E7]|uniref:trans-sulfuration enzyme family protein n=1 Tax=Eubacterium sp. 1001713B170207_170306_E7 TaxID=2787097 RepID=UPI00189C4F50|nr:PLP-dependent aspartate aminotransferase family protein [Eubacterium sp. 1001713B170207_170306_E7]